MVSNLNTLTGSLMSTNTSDSIIRIANCSGFYGDKLSAARDMVEGGPIDVLTGDYPAELTMAILHRKREADHVRALGYRKFPD